MKFDFYPSFYHHTQMTIDYNRKTLNINVFEDYYVEKLDYSDTTEPYIVESGDTLITFYNKTFSIEDNDLEKFKIAENKSQFNVKTFHKRRVLDGISFKATKINIENDTVFLNSISPIRNNNFKLDYALLDPLFELLYSSIDDNDGINIIEEIQEYFQYRLIRKTNDNPLEIRIYGILSGGCETKNNYLTSFLENLQDEPIIFDCRKALISYCTYSIFEELAKNRKIYFYGENKMFECFKDNQNALDEVYENNEDKDYKNEIWDKLKKKSNSKYNNWLNNPDIKWFKTKEEIIKHIANKG